MGVGVAATQGSKLYIGATDVYTTINGYEGENWTEVVDVEDLGEVGDESTLITFTAIGDGRTRKFKGPRDAGDMAVVLGYNSDDPGQTALRAAETTKDAYNFKIELNDGSPGSPSQPTILYFRAKVMSGRFRIGTASDVVRSGVQLAVDSAVLVDAAV